jgi:hypothetical protein
MISGKTPKIKLRSKGLRIYRSKTLNADRSLKPLGNKLTMRSKKDSNQLSLKFTSGARLPMAMFLEKSSVFKIESRTLKQGPPLELNSMR